MVEDNQNELVHLLRSALTGNRPSLRLPNFNISDPELWFAQVEEAHYIGSDCRT